MEGTIKKGESVVWRKRVRHDLAGQGRRAVLTEHLTRVPVESARQGDLVVVAGIEDIFIGETLAILHRIPSRCP